MSSGGVDNQPKNPNRRRVYVKGGSERERKGKEREGRGVRGDPLSPIFHNDSF